MKDLNITLQNSKVILRPLALSDEPLLWPLTQDEALWIYGIKDLTIREELHNYITAAINDRDAGTCAVWVIIDAATGEIAGSTRLAEISWKDERGQIGWTWLIPKFQGTGLNKAMKFEILRYGFETLGLNRIELKADARNERSRRAIEGIGAKPEGILRQHLKLHNGFLRDSAYYSILKSEWPEVKAGLLLQV